MKKTNLFVRMVAIFSQILGRDVSLEDVNFTPEETETLKEKIGEDDFDKIMNEFNHLATQKAETRELLQKLNSEVESQRLLNNALQDDVEPDNPRKIVASATHFSRNYLFGIENEFFSSKYRWNEAAIKRIASGREYSDKERQQFKEQLSFLGQSLADRYNFLQQNGLLEDVKMGNFDYSDLDDRWGAEYVVRRHDEIIKYMRSFPSVSTIFPVRYGIQDKEAITTAHILGDLSTAFVPDEIFSDATIKFQPEIAKVNDSMFNYKFIDLHLLEKTHIGYLNKEGSDTMKWSFIEWVIVAMFLPKLHREREQRRIIGAAAIPQANTYEHYLASADGVIERLITYTENNQVVRFDDLGFYTETTILEHFEEFHDRLFQLLPSLDGIAIYYNEKHQNWLKQAYWEKYHLDSNFEGAKKELTNFDYRNFIPVPYMGTLQYCWATIPGNIQLLELTAGEMTAIKFEQRMHTLIAWSRWHEGVGAELVGVKYATPQTEINPDHQFIFMTNPVIVLEADAATADVANAREVLTIANTAATDFTAFTNAKPGHCYKLQIGNVTNATTVTKAGNFTLIKEDFTPVAIGDFLKVYVTKSGAYREISRKVNGVTTFYNPNI